MDVKMVKESVDKISVKGKSKKKVSKAILFLILLLAVLGIVWLRMGDEIKVMYQEMSIRSILVSLVSIGLMLWVLGIIGINKVSAFRKRLSFQFMSVMIYFMIPMCAVIIIFLGALQAQVGWESTFMGDSAENLIIAGESFSEAFMSLVSKLWNLGRDRPVFYMLLCGGVTLVLLWNALRKGAEEYEDEKPIQSIIDEADYSLLTKEDLMDIEMLMKGKMRRKHLDELKKKLAKESHSPYVVIDVNRLKGGRTHK